MKRMSRMRMKGQTRMRTWSQHPASGRGRGRGGRPAKSAANLKTRAKAKSQAKGKAKSTAQTSSMKRPAAAANLGERSTRVQCTTSTSTRCWMCIGPARLLVSRCVMMGSRPCINFQSPHLRVSTFDSVSSYAYKGFSDTLFEPLA